MPELPKDLKELEEEIMKQLALEIFKHSQKNLIEDGSVDTGFLLRSGKIQKETDSYSIFYDAPYAQIINDGASRILVSPQQLEGWVRRKLKIKDPIKNKRVSIAISKKLRERGMEGTFFLWDRAIDQAEKSFKGKV